MSRSKPSGASPVKGAAIRCAIYTRKSSEEGLKQEFNSLDAQREAAEAYITSQKAEGMVTLPDRYDDGGFSGGTIERPAIKKLLADIQAGKVDCVVVYKVDRLSRSLMDFAKIMETFDAHHVSFVSVTQHFNTTHSMGRLTLNILLSFAQFEREIIGERIRDKISAQRRREWTGGRPMLGYEVDRSGPSPRLVVNPAEAPRVRQLFQMYLDEKSLLRVVTDINKRGWKQKQWRTRHGALKGGSEFDRSALHWLLTNPIYAGRVKHKDETFPGEHEPIVTEELFRQVQLLMQHNSRVGSHEARNQYGALLRRLLYCKACGCAMVHTSTRRGRVAYRYYTCCNAIKKGRERCPTGSLPAVEIERAVVEQIRCIGQDAGLMADTLAEARAQTEQAMAALVAERRIVEGGLTRCHTDLRRAATEEPATAGAAARIADLHEQIRKAEARLAEMAAETAQHQGDLLTAGDIIAAFADFDNVWTALAPREQIRVLQLLIGRVVYDALDSSMEVSFHPSGIKFLTAGALAAGTIPQEIAA